MQTLATVGFVALATAYTTTVTAAPANKTIRVMSAKGADAASPEAAIWQKSPVTQVVLQPAFPGHGSIVGTPMTENLTAQAVRAGDRLYVRLAWKDATPNTAIDDTNKFADGAAVQFPVNGKATTTPFMGDIQNAVNVWHWRADGRTLNLMAKGFGSSTVVPFEGLKSSAVRTGDGWAVVLARPLKVGADEGASLQGRKSMPIAFAAWDGENQERDGLKAVTLEWWQLRF
jgi:dimethylsulfide dehydrogenase subunit gamma/complex iron-sulfur molybdoenzyme family reductase subunit gamma